MNKPLSPAAQAVLDAFENASDGEYVEGVWVVNERTMLAAALRAAADQALPFRSTEGRGAGHGKCCAPPPPTYRRRAGGPR
jgi:hypothetical protein